MISKVDESQFQRLLELPESGMGYQFIEAEFGFYGFKRKYLVLNSSLLIDDTPQILNDIERVFLGGYPVALYTAESIDIKKITIVDSLSNLTIKSSSQSNNTGAIHQPVVNANGVDKYTRLSAFANDFRIDTRNNKLLPKSYTTTYTDYMHCKNKGLSPNERYALPNSETIKYAYHIRPLKSDTLQLGIVEPANGYKGGGVEAYFAKGTSNDTYLGRTDY